MANEKSPLSKVLELARGGEWEEAQRLCEQILAMEPSNAEAWSTLGAIYGAGQKISLAIDCLHNALRLRPDFPEALNNLGLISERQNKLGDAKAYYERAIQTNPAMGAAHYNLGNVLRLTNQPDAALQAYEKARLFEPGYAVATYNIGLVHLEQNRLQQAEAYFQAALGEKPSYVEAHHNLGYVYHRQGDFKRAEGAYRRAIELDPAFAEAKYNWSDLMLLTGDFDSGWREYEWRWKTGELPVRGFSQPRWSGEPLEGKTILLHAEQGLGDTIQFVRYAALVKERGGTVVVECQPALVKLLREGVGNWELGVGSPGTEGQRDGGTERRREGGGLGIDRLIAAGEVLPGFDFHCPLLSLPGVFGTRLETIPARVPYLFADEGLVRVWRERLDRLVGASKVQSPRSQVGRSGVEVHGSKQERGGPASAGADLSHPTAARPLWVGINWHGREGHREARRRDVPVELFAGLAEVPGVRLVSLQKGEVGGQRSEVGQTEPVAVGSGLNESLVGGAHPTIVDLGEFDTVHGAFMDTAAVMMNLDLVITSDTSVAHLAGALGVSVWVALPYVPDWRWLLDRADSPWYPTMRLFRQKRAGDWEGVFAEIRGALREGVGNRE
jgi:tetratricopeptide (TPR) repeat protein